MSDNLLGNVSIKLNNRYTILNKLGENGGRYTLLAKDLHTRQLVVIKALIFSEEFRWEDLKLFEREAETLKNLSHPAIPDYIDYFELNTSNIKGFSLVQTYIDAKSLQEQVRDGRNLNEKEIKQLGKSLLEVLDYLHSRQPAVIHRDIKPSNILLTKSYSQEIYTVFQQPRRNISRVVLEKKSYKLIETEYTEGRKQIEEHEVAPRLYLQIRKRRYGLNDYQLTTPELYWLAEEISDFLDIPINWI